MTVGLLIGCLGLRLTAATNLVVAGDDLQAKINAATSGDTLVVQSGTYPGNLSITKPLYLVCSGSGMVVLPNPVIINSPGFVHFSKFQIQSLATSTTNSSLRLVDSLIFGSLMHTGEMMLTDCVVSGDVTQSKGKALLRRVQIGGVLTITDSSLDALRMTNMGRVNLVSTSATNRPLALIVQSQMRAALVADKYQLLTGYSFAQGFHLKDTESKHVGLKVFYTTEVIPYYPPDSDDPYLVYKGCTTTKFYNNPSVRLDGGRHIFVGSKFLWSGNWRGDRGQSVVILSHHSDISIDNCDIFSWGTFSGWFDCGACGCYNGPFRSCGIYAVGGKVVVSNCFFQLMNDSAGNVNSVVGILSFSKPQVSLTDSVVYATTWHPQEANAIRTNSFNVKFTTENVVFGTNNVKTALIPPVKVDWTNQWDFQVSLVPNSPLINAGSKDPLKRNRDGSRNTIGSTGGPMYNPALATTDLPMAFWLGLMPQRIVKGLVNTVDLDTAAAAGH